MSEIDNLKPCARGHSGVRNSQGKCIECANMACRKYYHAHRDKERKRVSKNVIKRVLAEAKSIGINGDIRKAIENRILDKEMEDLLNG